MVSEPHGLFPIPINFGHFKICEYCSRPYTYLHEMDNALIRNWNELVQPEDTIYHLGDFSFKSNQYVDKLNGYKILIKGNHDHDKYDKLFDEVYDMAELKIGEFNCLLIHQPLEEDRQYKKWEPDVRWGEQYDYIVCGHIHQLWKVNGKHINVGVDVWDYKPIHIDTLHNFMKELKNENL